MIRTPKLVWVLAAMIILLLGIGLVQYANVERSPAPPALRTAQLQPSVRPPAIPPAVVLPVLPAVPSGPAPPPAAAPAAPSPAPTVVQASPPTFTYVVQPHDTLWDLAAAHLGNPLRWQELYDLNRGRIEPGGIVFLNPNVIDVGWTLQFPAGATGLGGGSVGSIAGPPAVLPSAAPGPAPPSVAAAANLSSTPALVQASPTTFTYVVQPHDTLWDLAAAHLGNPLRWQELYDLNRGRIEPGGSVLLNPDVIDVGWTLQFPAGATGLGGGSVDSNGGPPA